MRIAHRNDVYLNLFTIDVDGFVVGRLERGRTHADRNQSVVADPRAYVTGRTLQREILCNSASEVARNAANAVAAVTSEKVPSPLL